MGWLVDGTWQDELQATKTSDGKFVRRPAQFRNWVTSDGKPGPGGLAAQRRLGRAPGEPAGLRLRLLPSRVACGHLDL